MGHQVAANTAPLVPDVGANEVKLHIAGLSGEGFIELSLEGSATVSDVKAAIAQSTLDIPVAEQRLVVGSDVIKDDQILESLATPRAPGGLPALVTLSLVRQWALGCTLSGSYDGTLRVWDLDAREVVRTSQRAHSGPVRCIGADWSTRRALSSSKDKKVILWSIDSGEPLRVLNGHAAAVLCVAAAWTSDRAVSGGLDGTLHLWDLAKAVTLMTMTGHQGAIWCVDMEWTSRLALTGSADQDVRLWNLESGACIRRMRGHAGPVRCLAVDWRARRALSGGRDDTALIWAFECDNPPVLDLPEHKPLVLCVGLHYATHRAIAGDEGISGFGTSETKRPMACSLRLLCARCAAWAALSMRWQWIGDGCVLSVATTSLYVSGTLMRASASSFSGVTLVQCWAWIQNGQGWSGTTSMVK